MQVGKKTGNYSGFTIVELLIVIVVIGILAAIALIAYGGIQSRARVATVQSDLKQAAKQLDSYKFSVSTSEQYPADLTTANLKGSTNTTYQYSVNNSVSPATFCLTATNGTTSYYVSSTTTTPTTGGCAGHGVGGVAAVTNLSRNPSLETDITDWGNYTGTTGSAGGARIATGGYAGSAYFRQTWTASQTANSGSGPTYGYNGAVGSTTYTISEWVRPSKTQRLRLVAEFYDASTTYISNANSITFDLAANTWTFMSGTFTTPANTVRIKTLLSTSGTGGSLWLTNDTLDVDAMIITQGSTVYNFADGNSSNWVWNGTPNNSTSTGPPL